MTPKDSALDLVTSFDSEREVRWQTVLEEACKVAEVEYVGIQRPLFPETHPKLIFQRNKKTFQFALDMTLKPASISWLVKQIVRKFHQEEPPVKTQELNLDNAPTLHDSQPLLVPISPVSSSDLLRALKGKMHSVYSEIENIAKNGTNDRQHYKYTQAADVVDTVRAALIKVGVYAEVNFEFAGESLTVARKDGPAMSAERVRCSIIFHDLDSAATLTSSGLGVGADSGDKGVFKAETGALKKALLAAFLIPEMDAKQADPEGDPNVDEPQSFDEHGAVYPQSPEAQQQQYHPPVPKQTMNFAPVAARPATISESPSTLAVAGAMPDDKQMEAYRAKFKSLGDDLAVNGGLKASKGLPINTKLKVYMLNMEVSSDPKEMTTPQWEHFFKTVEEIVTGSGWAHLSQLINITNGTAKEAA